MQPPSGVLGAAAFIDAMCCLAILYSDDTSTPGTTSWRGLWREGKIHVSRRARQSQEKPLI